MKELLELLQTYAAKWGISEGFLNVLALLTIVVVALGIILPVFSTLWKGFKMLILWRNQSILNKDLSPFYTSLDVEKATRYYVPTNYQNVSPSEDNEPSRKYIATPKAPLIPLFLKEAFPIGKNYNKYYLILADTGMGKTTFLINLYISYKNQWNLFGTPKYDIKLFPLGSSETFTAIKKIEKPENTILLLDAFDEDVKALHNYNERMKELLAIVKDFREIVITCRTQFFPSEEEEPHKTGYFTFGEHGQYQFQKLYVSVFQDADIKKYLGKRFPIYQWKKRKQAWQITKKSPNLVMRPMLLSHIQDLLDEQREYEFSFEVYDKMIEKWIDREARKPGIQQKYGSIYAYKQLLNAFSQKLAVDMYANRKDRNGYFIGKEEGYGQEIAEMIEESTEPRMDESERRSRSLLNRNAEGKYKFAHKSIMEYFLTQELMSNPLFYTSFDFEGMEATSLFFNEIMTARLRKIKGTFTLDGANDKPKSLNSLKLSYINNIREIKIEEAISHHYLSSRIPNIKKITIRDKLKYSILYIIYLAIWLDRLELGERLYLLERLHLLERLEVGELRELRELGEWLQMGERLELLELREQLEQLDLLHLREQLEQLEQRERLELPERQELRERLEQPDMLELQKLQKLRELRERLELRELRELVLKISNKDPKTQLQLEEINQFLKDMKELKKHLPQDCKLIY